MQTTLTTPISPHPTLVADTYIEACTADLMLRAGREHGAGPRRFYRAAANALQRVRRAYADEVRDARGSAESNAPEAVYAPATAGDAEDQGGVQ